MEREIRLHIALDHENIIKLYSAFEDEKNVYMVQEFAGSGDLFEELRRNGGLVKEKYAVRDVLAPFLNSLCYLHNLDIIHRDIKPENILVTSTKMIKLADFGLGIDCSDERPVTRCGTLDYMAPEVLICPDKKRPEENKDKTLLVYGTSIDVWAVGILAFELLTGSPPFEKDSRSDTYDSIMYQEPELPVAMSSEAKSFILAALNKSSATRVTVFDLLKHPWITQYSNPKHLLASTECSAHSTSPTVSTPSLHRLSRAGHSETAPEAPSSPFMKSSYQHIDINPDNARDLMAKAPMTAHVYLSSNAQGLANPLLSHLQPQSSSFTPNRQPPEPNISLPSLLAPKPSFGVLSDDSRFGQGPSSPQQRPNPLNTIAKVMNMEPGAGLKSSSSQRRVNSISNLYRIQFLTLSTRPQLQ